MLIFVEEFKKFIGLLNWFRKFMLNFSVIFKLFYEFLCKGFFFI